MFPQNELRPALERTGRVVVYVDLWSDKSRNPGVLIAQAVAAGLQKHLLLPGVRVCDLPLEQSAMCNVQRAILRRAAEFGQS